MNKAQRKYVADFEANRAGKQYNIYDCITFATEFKQIDPKPDPCYIVLLGNRQINKFESLEDANSFLLNTIKNCFSLPGLKLVKFQSNYILRVEKTDGDKTKILSYTIIEEESLKEKERDAFFDQWPP